MSATNVLRLVAASLVCVGLSRPVSSFAADGDDAKSPKVYTQAAEVVESQTPGATSPDTPAAERADNHRKLLTEGPVPTWIWGPSNDKTWFLRTTFAGGAKAALLKATSDNHMTVFINGKRVAHSDEWQAPVELDVQKYVRDGENELLAEVSNDGGIAAFVLKLVLIDADDQPHYVVSDDSWKVSATRESQENVAVKTLGKLGVGPWNDVFARPSTTGASRGVFNVPAGFQVERLFTVPKDELGSWVSVGLDNKGRIIASDQGDKGLVRITPAPLGTTDDTQVERLDLPLTSAQGILYAFDSLYLSINGGPGSGLYRARDTNGDDQYDEVVKLKGLRGGGEHGPHALRLSPDGKSIYLICGNHTDPPFNAGQDKNHPEFSSRMPTNWNEDLLLPRQWDANGHARGRMAPGGWIAKTDPDGKTWEIVSSGYRNPYDMDFNADGELFAYDADMEWDFGMPWYRPTRVVHATSGSEFGWRSGTGKWPTYYVDSLPQLVDIGPGSPVGVTFGYGTKFPAKYQRALYICDWTFGTMYAIHIEPDGASYRAVKEEFVSRTPLPLTDNVVGPDGALYFTVGGRGTQSELFRVTYVGDDATDPVDTHDTAGADLRALRHQLEAFQQDSVANDKQAVATIWPALGHADRHIRYAARVALEHRPVALWQDRVLAETDPQTLITACVAFAHQGDAGRQAAVLEALERLDFAALTQTQQLELLRVYQLIFARLGEPAEDVQTRLAEKLDAFYPADSDALNRELCILLVYLKSPNVVRKTIPVLAQDPKRPEVDMTELLARNGGYGGTVAQVLLNHPDMQQVHYVFTLRNLKKGWTLDERKAYFQWFEKARTWSGGASYQKFLTNIDNDAFANATDNERLAIEAAGARKPFVRPELPKPTGPGQDWSTADVVALAENGLSKRDFKNGEKMFAAARCVLCHRFGGDGGATGPDLTQLAGRFNVKDLTDSIVDPSKVISDQYKASIIVTNDGKVHTGRIVSETKSTLMLLTDPEDSTKVIEIERDDIDELNPSPVSVMPKDLLKPLNENEVLDLLAYLLSRGNPNDPMFRK